MNEQESEYVIPDERPNAPLPNDLGGYQSLVGHEIEPEETVGGGQFRVYRKMDVPSQGGIDHPLLAATAEACDKAVAIFGQNIFPAGHFIPQDSDERKQAPMFRGLLGYFPAALFEVARHSLLSDKKHNPGATDAPYWARGKSADHPDCIVRHLIDAGDHNTPDRLEHLRALAWRSLAMLQEECERRGARPGVRSKQPTP